MWEQRYFNHSNIRTLDTAKLISNNLLSEILEPPKSITLVVLGQKNDVLKNSIKNLGIDFKSVLFIENVVGGVFHLFQNPTQSLLVVGSFSHSGISKNKHVFLGDPLRYFDLVLEKECLLELKRSNQDLQEYSAIVDKNKKPTLLTSSNKSLLNVYTDFEDQLKLISKLKKLASQNVISHIVSIWSFEHLNKFTFKKGVWDLSSLSFSDAMLTLSSKVNTCSVEKIYFKCQSIELRLMLWKKFKSHSGVQFDYLDIIMEQSLSSSLIKIASNVESSIIICLDEYPKISYLKMETA